MLAIIGAMEEEIELLLADLKGRTDLARPGAMLHQGQLGSQPILLTKAGIGKVNAALTTAHLLAAGATQLIFTGVAGALDPALGVGDIVISTDLVQHDVDVTALNYELGQVPGEPLSWAADPQLQARALAAAQQLAGVRVMNGRIASGDQFIASTKRVQEIRTQFSALCAEMEGAAVAQVCAKAGIPFVIIRSISDTADHSAQIDYRSFMPQVALHAKQVVRAML